METRTTDTGMQEIHTSGPRGRPLIGRIWTGRTRAEVADEYLEYVYENGVLEIERKPGSLGVQQFRKVEGDTAEFTTISYWESMESMEAMHDGGESGDTRRVAHLPKDPEYLLELPELTEIVEVWVNDWDLGA